MSPVNRSPKIDTVPLPEMEFGMIIKSGKISKLKDKYFLTLGKRKLEIPVGTLVSKTDIDRLAGEIVVAAFSKRKPSEIVAIGRLGLLKQRINFKGWIICYIPAPDMIRRIDVELRHDLIERMVGDKIITREFAENIAQR